ncbi:MAG: glycosyltransferase domain-containing protein, partial [Candidatus Paceibacteria bacterium]
MSEKTVVYTSIFDDYDVLMDPKYEPQNIDFVCFTDSDLSSGIWEIRNHSSSSISPKMMNRKLKLFPHKFLKEYEYSIYIDGNIQVMRDLNQFIQTYCNDSNFVAYHHPGRDCVYEEAQRCIELGLGREKLINDQIKKYRDEGLPENIGLSDNSVLFRNHSDEAIRYLMDKWWEEIKMESGRDQIALPYVAWKYDIDYKLLPNNYRWT